jgi:hypothetical protein
VVFEERNIPFLNSYYIGVDAQGEISPEEKLKNDIRDKLMKWLVDYEIKDPLELSKNEILDLVDEIIYRLSLQIKK